MRPFWRIKVSQGVFADAVSEPVKMNIPHLEGLYFLRNGRLVHGTSGRSPSIVGRRPDRLWASLRRPLSKNHRQENINANCQPTLCHKTEFLMQRPIIRRDLREKGWILHAKECWAICCNQAHMMYN